MRCTAWCRETWRSRGREVFKDLNVARRGYDRYDGVHGRASSGAQSRAWWFWKPRPDGGRASAGRARCGNTARRDLAGAVGALAVLPR